MLGADLDIAAADVVNAGYRHGLLLVNAGPNTLRLVPPLVITREEIDLLIERLNADLPRAIGIKGNLGTQAWRITIRPAAEADIEGILQHRQRLRRAKPDAAADAANRSGVC